MNQNDFSFDKGSVGKRQTKAIKLNNTIFNKNKLTMETIKNGSESVRHSKNDNIQINQNTLNSR